MLKPCTDLIEKLIRHDQRTGFTYGNKPRFEMREKPLLHHFSSSFLPENQNRWEGRSCGSLCCPGRKRFRFPARFAKEPDQHSSTISLWIAHYRPTSVMNPRAINVEPRLVRYPFLSLQQLPASVRDSSRQNPRQGATLGRCSRSRPI